MADTIVFTVKGKQYPMPKQLTFGDAALLKKLGINLGELSRAVQDEDVSLLADPVVMGGMLLVSMKHAGVKVTANSLNDLEINEVGVEVPEGEDEGEDDVPLVPTEPPPTPPSSSGTTHDDSGPPDSGTSLESILGS